MLRVAFTDGAVLAQDEQTPGSVGLRDLLAERLCRGLQAGMESGALRSDYEPRTLAHAIVGLVESALVHGGREGRDRHELVAEISLFCSRALVRVRDPQEDSP